MSELTNRSLASAVVAALTAGGGAGVGAGLSGVAALSGELCEIMAESSITMPDAFV